jgi:hypothetical protein
MPAVPASLLEPIWAELTTLLPERGEFHPDHPLGRHGRRIPDRVVFERLIEALVHGSGYERIASSACSDATIRRRLKQWAGAGIAGQFPRTAGRLKASTLTRDHSSAPASPSSSSSSSWSRSKTPPCAHSLKAASSSLRCRSRTRRPAATPTGSRCDT